MAARIDRAGHIAAYMNYEPGEWTERGIKARRFLPCPHCGGAVAARERVFTPKTLRDMQRAGQGVTVFRSAYCVRGCGWHFEGIDGSRDSFVARCNERGGRNAADLEHDDEHPDGACVRVPDYQGDAVCNHTLREGKG